MSPELNDVLLDMIKIIYHSKAYGFNSCQFVQLCEKMDSNKAHTT